VFTRRIFDGVVITTLLIHLAVGLPRMWARRVVSTDNEPTYKRLVGAGVLHATS
jgi:hypothetical protein